MSEESRSEKDVIVLNEARKFLLKNLFIIILSVWAYNFEFMVSKPTQGRTVIIDGTPQPITSIHTGEYILRDSPIFWFLIGTITFIIWWLFAGRIFTKAELENQVSK